MSLMKIHLLHYIPMYRGPILGIGKQVPKLVTNSYETRLVKMGVGVLYTTVCTWFIMDLGRSMGCKEEMFRSPMENSKSDFRLNPVRSSANLGAVCSDRVR